MKFKYNLSEKDYQKILYEKNSKTNIFYIILISIFFLFVTKDLIADNTLLIFGLYMLYIGIMLLFMWILNKVFTNIMIKINKKSTDQYYGTWDCQITKDKIIESIGGKQFIVLLKNIKKIDKKKETTIITDKTQGMVLIFKKSLFENPEKYEEFIKILDKNTQNL